MLAIILAAGRGSRLDPITKYQPKCLTKINGEAILFNQLNNLEKSGIRQVRIVTGYLNSCIETSVGKRHGAITIEYTLNADYAQTGTSYSLWCALTAECQFHDCLLVEADVMFDLTLLEPLMASKYEAATLVEAYQPHLDGSFVEIDSEGFVVDWIHKDARDENFTKEDKYKTINITKVSGRFIKEKLMPALEFSIFKKSKKRHLEHVMRDVVLSNKQGIKAVVNKGARWCEIDDKEDMIIAERLFQKDHLSEIDNL